MSKVHHDWLAKWGREVEEEYVRLHDIARRDPQLSGHGAESSWNRLLEEWLPQGYEVGVRKYIVPEEGDDVFETDLVVFSPGYPSRLRQREEVLAGGVAAAFSVKLTLDAAGIRDAADRAARLRRSMKVRKGSPRSEMLGAFPVGLLAHSHAWKSPRSTPRQNLERHLTASDDATATHPRESLDLVCVADLATVTTLRIPFMPPNNLGHLIAQGVDVGPGLAVQSMVITNEGSVPTPVAVLVAALVGRLAMQDTSIRAFADGLRMTNTLGSARGVSRHYTLASTFSPGVVDLLPVRAAREGDWAVAFS